jgi:hypothetical protein
MKTILAKFCVVACGLALVACDLKRDAGLWRGTVVVRDEVRGNSLCDLEVDITHSSEHLMIHHVAVSCDGFRAKWHPGNYEIHAGAIWKNGRAVGWEHNDGSVTLELNDFTMDSRYPFPAHRVVLSWSLAGDSLDYREDSYFAGRVQSTSGWLRKVR